MAYQGCDTFDHYNTALLTALGFYETIAGSPVVGAYNRFPAIGSYPNQGVSLPVAGIRKNLKSNQGTLIGFLSFGAASLANTPAPIMSFLDNGVVQCFLGFTNTGALQFYTQASTFNAVAIGPSSAIGLIAPTPTANPNHGIEIKVVFSNGGGSVLCYLDGVLVIALTGSLVTIKSANAYANQVSIGGNGSGYGTPGSIYCDYWRVWDATGSFQNAPTGLDCRKLTKLPTGVGDLTNWTPNGAANNWQCVNEIPPDSDTTYVSAASTILDSYAMGSAGLVVAPTMVVAKSYARKDDGATRALEIGVRSSGVNGLGSPITMGSSYGFVDSCISTDPATGVAPTAAAADAFQHCKFEST